MTGNYSSELLQRKLAETPSFELPLPRRHLASKQASGTSQCKRISASLGSRLEAFSAARSVPAAVTLLALFTALLHRYTGVENVCLSTRLRTDSRLRRYAAPFWGVVHGDLSFADHL